MNPGCAKKPGPRPCGDIGVVHVPHRGNAAAVTDLLAGQVQVYFGTPADIFPHVGGGKVRVIAVADTLRFPQLPDVPTTVESGFPNLTAEFWSGILVPAGTPVSIVDQLNVAINESMRSPDARLALKQTGGKAKLATPEDFKVHHCGNAGVVGDHKGYRREDRLSTIGQRQQSRGKHAIPANGCFTPLPD
jgi:hypothetical protein